jgi:MoxR-like ATPase
MGEAGWGKTSIIKDMAKRDGRYIITVYLDKAVATDLGGIPVPIPIKKGDEDNAKIVNAMPDWAAYMLEHPKDQFLLFFDEMNQAAPDVMNALMPIVLENVICNIQFKNFMVGAAGNFEHENRSGVNELSGPLESRFKPIIIWESGDESSWQQAFKYMEKEWGEKVNVKILKLLAENAQCFNNPREVEHKILKWAYKISNKIKDGKTFAMDSDETLDQITRLINSDKNLNRTQQDALGVISEEITKWINDPDNYGKEEETGRKRGKGRDMIPDELKESIIKGMKRGYVEGMDSKTGNKAKFGISRENISSVFCTDEFIDPEDEESYEEPINAEMLERLITKLEADGIKFKYETNDEFIKKGLKNPAD